MRAGRQALLVLLLATSSLACRDKRRPIARGDAGPSVVVVEGHALEPELAPASPEREPNDSAQAAQALEPDARIGAVIALVPAAGGADVDWYVVAARSAAGDVAGAIDLAVGAAQPTLDAGLAPPSVAFVTLRAGAEPLALELVDIRGRILKARVAPAHGRAQLSYLRLDPAAPTLLRVRRPAGLKAPAVGAADYTLEQSTRLAMLDEELEPNDDARHAGALSAASSLTGRLDGHADRDVIALPALPEGATYRVELAGLPELAPELRLRDGESVIATARTGRGGELRLRNLPGRGTGALFLELRGIDGESELPYTLRVSSESAIDAPVEHEPNDDRARANLVRPGDVLSGYLWPGDVDWFCTSTEADLGAHIDGTPEVDWKLETFDVAGKSRKKADEGRRGAAEQIAAEAGARCVRVSARPRDGVYDAPYRLSFSGLP